MTPEFHPAAKDELAEAIKIGELRAARLGRELLFETQRVVAVSAVSSATFSFQHRVSNRRISFAYSCICTSTPAPIVRRESVPDGDLALAYEMAGTNAL